MIRFLRRLWRRLFADWNCRNCGSQTHPEHTSEYSGVVSWVDVCDNCGERTARVQRAVRAGRPEL